MSIYNEYWSSYLERQIRKEREKLLDKEYYIVMDQNDKEVTGKALTKDEAIQFAENKWKPFTWLDLKSKGFYVVHYSSAPTVEKLN
jgi:hypothetical protein